ncbi:MAG: xanthine dehydrogenase [Frankiales bacterium]|jgi:xanthine dehydrogenase accessory factor|nr:xanthine dehydrogenase [Frankiales bacterium]
MNPTRLVLVFVSPLAQELAVLADRLRWPVTVVDPDRTRLDADPVPYARTVTSVAAARLDAGCDVVVCDHDRPEFEAVLAELLAGPSRLHPPAGPDLGSHSPPEIAIATVAGMLADLRSV